MRLLATTSALIALAGAVPAAAHAGVTTHIPAAPLSGPVVADGQAVWASPRRDEGFNLLAAQPGGPYRTVRRFPSFVEPDNHSVYLAPQLSAAGSRIGLAFDAQPIPFDRYDQYYEPAGADVLAGPPGGPLASVLHCRPGLPAGVTAAATEHGMVLSGPGCDAARASGLALQSDTGANDPRPLTPTGARVRAAGPFVGWLGRKGELVVYDTTTRAVVYSIATPEEGRIADWDLQADGKVALAVAPDRDGPAALAWYSPGEPTPHPLGVPPAYDWDLHFAGDRVGYLRSDRVWGRGYYFGALGATDLTGHTRAISNRAIGVEGWHPSFAFDGTNATWAGPACFGAVLHSQSLDEAPVSEPRPRCPLRFRKRPTMLGKNSIRIPVRCSGFVLPDCSSSRVKLEALKPHVAMGSEDVRYCDLTADVLLSRRGAALVRRFKTLRVRATVTARDTAGAREVRTANFTLKTRHRITDANTCFDEY
jgi:hypothetical protein